MTEKRMLNRLEDFMYLARKGEKVDLTVKLNKQIFTRKFDPYTIGDSEDEIDMCILSADYVFSVGGKTYKVTKLYAYGIEGESLDTTDSNIYIANERLKMDYKRLRKVKIVFKEKLWNEKL